MSAVVVVGGDGSTESVRALRWALAAAAERHWRLEVVTAWPHTGPVFVREVPGHHRDARERARVAPADALRRALAETPAAVPVSMVLENARPEDPLVLRARGKQLLVVGTSGGPVEEHRTGLAGRCRVQVDCPVAVVPADVDDARILEPLARAPG